MESSPCQKIVGFLFPRTCGRTDRTNCPYCRGQAGGPDNYYLANNHPYRTDRALYPNYGTYTESGGWVEIDFTEADGAALIPDPRDYEQDMGAS